MSATCDKCGRPKSKDGHDKGRTRPARCRRAPCRSLRSTPPTPEHVTVALPWCVTCRRRMQRKGAGQKGGQRFRCGACGLPMTLHSSGAFGCQRCYRLRRERREADALRVLAHVTSRLPGYLTPDEKEDAAQSILLDMLAGALRPCDLTPLTLRRYAAEARGTLADPFKFISLSAPTRYGREFGDTLAA